MNFIRPFYKVNEYQNFHISNTGRREDSLGLGIVGDVPFDKTVKKFYVL